MMYKANPVIVEAHRIEHIGAEYRGAVPLTIEGGQRVTASPEMLARMTPEPGDYWVKQEDGYIYLNPKAVFERKYSPVTHLPIHLEAS